MNLNIRKLLYEADKTEHGAIEFNFSNWDFSGFTIPTPVLFSWKAVAKNEIITFELSLDATIQADCGRCSEPAQVQWHLDNAYTITEANLEEEFPELPILSKSMLDLAELAYSELVMDVPMSITCPDGCKNACSQCHLPESACRCGQSSAAGIDPRLKVLQDLLNADKALN